MKRFLYLLLALILLTAPYLSAQADEPYTLSFSVWESHSGLTWVDTPVYDEWVARAEEYLGVKLDMRIEEIPLGDQIEKMATYIASGDIADVVHVWNNPASIVMTNEMGYANMVVDLAEYEHLLTYYQAYLEDNRQYVTSPEGNMFAFAQGVYDVNTGSQMSFAMRADILKQHDLTPPNTYDELYEVCLKLKEIYPDSYPLCILQGSWDGLNTNLFAMNRVYYNKIYYDGEEFVYGPFSDRSTERFREVVEWFSKMYKAGLIDPEFLTLTSEQLEARLLNGTYFFSNCMHTGTFKKYNENEVYDVEWCHIPMMKSFDGKFGWKYEPGIEGLRFRLWDKIVINSNVSEKDRELLIKLIDYEYSPEMRMLENWGIEGVTYTMTEDGPVWMDFVKEGGAKTLEPYGCYASVTCRPGFGGSRICDLQAEQTLQPDTPSYADGEYFDMNIWVFSDKYDGGEEGVCPGERMATNLSSDDLDEVNYIMTAINTYVFENTIKFMTDARDMSEWDAFIDEGKKLGDWQKAIEIYSATLQ